MRKKIFVNEAYDVSQDTYKHIELVKHNMSVLVADMENRANNHDKSKFDEPEFSAYNEYVPKLKQLKYGSDEYNDTVEQMRMAGTQHHIEVNRHHPEHFENGIKGMNLVDLVEMFCDWYAASLRSDSNFEEGLLINQKKFNIPDELFRILMNTYNEYFKGNKI